MAIPASISRLTAFYARHGLAATVRRASLAARRALFSGRMVLLYSDLAAQSLSPADLPSFLKVERKRDETELSPQDVHEITNFWNPKLARRRIKERFDLGASLWLIKSEGWLAGYGWTLQGHTVEPHYFRLGTDDVHLFDFHVFPQFRGRGLNPVLVSYILRSLAVDCQGRAFIEAAEWNQAQLASLGRTSFHRLGSARKFTLFRHTIVSWETNKSMRQSQDSSGNPPRPVANRRTSQEKA
jgi:ribosomal protein S18 acetylase RimI-like enzyme